MPAAAATRKLARPLRVQRRRERSGRVWPPTRSVRDRAQPFDAAFAAELERALSAFQLETRHHLMVVSVASLEGSTLESYALQRCTSRPAT